MRSKLFFTNFRVLIVFILSFILWSCTSGDDVVDYSSNSKEISGDNLNEYNEERNVYFGDLHVHTKHSFDAFIFGTTATPDDAYRYAKGESIKHALGFDMQLREPLDFYAVTDHGFLLGNVPFWADPNNGKKGSEPFHNLNREENRTFASIPERANLFGYYVRNIASSVSYWGAIQYLFTGDQARASSMYDVGVHRTAWRDVINSAQDHYEPGKFTTFIAYEYTSSSTFTDNGKTWLNPFGKGPYEGGNLHRNVIFSGSKATVEPFTRLKSLNPEDLWAWMDRIREQGVDTIAIPHNSNGSNGQMFEIENWNGYPLNDVYADFRMRNEPLVEVTQVKGTSDTHPLLSPNDEWADFEIMSYRVGTNAYSRPFGSYARQAYLDGLILQEENRGNPYKFGMVGASDTHTGATSDDESNFFSKIGILDGTAELRGSVPLSSEMISAMGMDSDNNNSLSLDADETSATSRLVTVKKIGNNYYNNPPFREWSASGLAVVWAEQNTRESIFNAFRRKETYATSGTRIKLRFFAGDNFVDSMLSDQNMVKTAYKKGVPMGGDLVYSGEDSPDFLVWAIRDKNGAPLQRIQIIKGSVTEISGHPTEKVYDVVCSDGLTVDPKTNRCPDNGATVNLSDCSISSGVGDSELKALWKDPDFNPKQKSFYYVRVLENPTCRWSTWDAVKNGSKPRPDLHKTIQERAWSSPVWFTPNS
tara:strand:- start:6902 stop:9013 length:2112 start_codon:yes stop_codon:yes gene_type:complete